MLKYDDVAQLGFDPEAAPQSAQRWIEVMALTPAQAGRWLDAHSGSVQPSSAHWGVVALLALGRRDDAARIAAHQASDEQVRRAAAAIRGFWTRAALRHVPGGPLNENEISERYQTATGLVWPWRPMLTPHTRAEAHLLAEADPSAYAAACYEALRAEMDTLAAEAGSFGYRLTRQIAEAWGVDHDSVRRGTDWPWEDWQTWGTWKYGGASIDHTPPIPTADDFAALRAAQHAVSRRAA